MKSLKSVVKSNENDNIESDDESYLSQDNEMEFDLDDNEIDDESANSDYDGNNEEDDDDDEDCCENESDLESEEDSGSDLIEEVNTKANSMQMKMLLKKEEDKIKLRNKLDKEKRSKKALEKKEENECISQFEEKLLNYLDEDERKYLPVSDDEDKVDSEEDLKVTDDINDEESNDENDSDKDEFECNIDSEMTEEEIVLPEKTILIKQAKQLKDCQKHEEKIRTEKSLKWKNKILNQKYIKRTSKKNYLKMIKLKKL